MTTTPDSGFDLDIADRVATITFNREHRANALTVANTHELASCVDRLGRNDDVWVIVFTGRGSRFCAGLDLHAADSPGIAEQLAALPAGGTHRTMHEVILECPKPTIAALNGVALGGGMEIALACDLRLAVRGVQVGFPEAKRGMGALFASHVLPRLISRARAYQLLYLGEFIDAETAVAWGLVNDVVEPDELPSAIARLTTAIVANAPLSLRRFKNSITAGESLPLAAALRLDVGANPYRSNDREEGIRAWREGREPQWTAT